MGDLDEFNKGYYGGGTPNSYAERQGMEARERHRQAEAERIMYQNDCGAAPPVSSPFVGDGGRHELPKISSDPPTFWGTVKGFAVMGCVLGTAYGLITLKVLTWQAIAQFSLEGLVIGASAGIILYLIGLVFRATAWTLSLVFKIAFWPAVLLAMLYFLIGAI